jgi:hypothetical protein
MFFKEDKISPKSTKILRGPFKSPYLFLFFSTSARYSLFFLAQNNLLGLFRYFLG